MFKAFYLYFYYELRSIFRTRSQWVHPIIFFIIFISLFGIGLGFEKTQLAALAPMMIWIAFLLTSLFTIENLFRSDQEEGVLAQLILNPIPLWWSLLAKSLASWVATALPLVSVIPFVGMSLHLSFSEIGWLLLSILIGSPALIFIGTIGAILTITLPRSGVLLGILLLPLYVPILILGIPSQWPLFQLALLGALSIFAMTFAPFITAAALKAVMDE